MPTRSRYISNFIISGNDIANGAITFSDLGVIYTSNITEGTNLYFSNARARAALSVTGAATYDNSTGIINVTGGVTSVNGSNGAVVLSTVNIAESGNLYFTNARARAALSVTGAATYDNSTGIINVTGGVTSVNSANGAVVLSTANIAESGNLYFTNARARTAISVSGSGSYDSANGIITISGAQGGGSDKIFYENDANVSSDYTVTAGKNAMSAGPITVNSGVTVTVPANSTWTVV